MRDLLFLLVLLSTAVSAQTRDYAKWVNPFIGTGGHGHTFPGATMPFGMVQLSPDTRIDNWDGSSGYHYSDDTIYGFSHTHLNGTGIPDYCDILFMPTVGGRSANGYASKFSHANEKAEPGYYSVQLDNKIDVELTASTRVGLHRYTFPTKGSASAVLDLKWRDKLLDSSIQLVGNKRIEGFRKSSSWAKEQTIYFVAEFSKPYVRAAAGTGQTDGAGSNSQSAVSTGFNTKKYQNEYEFNVAAGEKILLKVAISNVSIEGARKNLETELPGWDFDKVRADAKAAWNKELSKIEVSGGTDAQTTTFYTALYHTMIQPNIFNDVDGSYLGHDKKIHQLPGYPSVPLAERRSSASPESPDSLRGSAADPKGRHSRKDENEQLRKSTAFPLGEGQSPKNPRSQIQNPKSNQYTVFSLWDTFRAAHPLHTIIDQKRTVGFINTFIRIYEQGGRLPVWELWGNETDCMIGYHAVSVIADAMAKGIKGFDYEKAYAAAKHSAELDHFGLAAYKKRGYISMEDENESVSRTMEYAYDDWCIAQMARIIYELKKPVPQPGRLTRLGDSDEDARLARYLDDQQRYSSRARYFENLFDPKTGFFRPKKNGGFVEPFAPNEVTFGFTEGNSWQYSFFVPQDVSRLMELQGGREKFIAKLDELFTTDQKLAGREQADLTGLIGQYAHGNEPSHHIAYLYDYAGEPWKTQNLVRQIMDEFYKPEPDGLIGNEDCGQMSAWYVLSASGFYPVNPGDGIYAFGTPLFPEVKYNLENGKTFIIRAKNVSTADKYIRKAKLNEAQYKKAFITHADLMKGGVLEFSMTDSPVTTAFTEFPVSSLKVETVAVPDIWADRTFSEITRVRMASVTADTAIYYSIDGSMPTRKSNLYTKPFVVDESTTVTAVAVSGDGRQSFPVEALLTKRPHDWTVKVLSGYSTQYTGGGDNAIVDGIRGTVNFASGEWQGVQGTTYEAVVDLQRETEVKELGASFLQVAGPWIWMPANIKFEISNNGTDWSQAAEIKPEFPQTEMTPTIKEFRQAIKPVNARYVRLRAFNFGKIPAWHPGAGGDPWIFIDEILIK
jgi:putative alpha-1,2-mannosidase